MIDLNRHAPLANPRLVGQTAEEAEQFRTTSNNFANNQVSSVQKEFMSPDDDYECCPNCNRKFFSGRLQLHLKSCKEGKPLKPIKGKTLPKANQTLRSEGGLGANRATETTPRESQREGSAVYQDEEDFEPSFGNQRKSPIIMNVKSPPIRGAKAQEYEEYEVRGNNRNVGYSDNEEGEEEVEENSPNKDNMEENENPVGDEERVPCGVCGRNFHPDRVEKHEKACKKSNKKRPVFDTTKQRMVAEQGELVKKGVSKPPKKAPVQKEKPVLEATGGHGEEQEGGEQTKKVPAWKSQHENFIKNIKFNRKLKEMEAKGEDTSHLVAPTMANDDYVPCPYCSRKFAPATAERHIPKCKNTFNRPKPPPKALKIERPEDVGPRNERIDRSKTQFILRKSTTSNPNKKSPEKGEITPSSQGNCTINMSEKGISNRSPQSAFSTGNYERNLEELMKEKSTPGGHRGSLKKMSSVEFSGKQNGMADQRKQEMIDNMGMGHEIKMPERKNFRSQSPGAKEEKKVFMEAMPKKDELLKNYQGVGARASNYATETCPHCQRNFAKHAAERHIPVCRSMASRLPKKSEAEMMGTTKGKMLGTTMAFRNRSIEREEQGSQRLGNTGNHTNYDQFGSQEKARHSDKPPLPAKKSLGDTEGYSAEKPPLKPKMFSTGSNFCTSCGCKSLKTHKFCGNCGMKKGV